MKDDQASLEKLRRDAAEVPDLSKHLFRVRDQKAASGLGPAATWLLSPVLLQRLNLREAPPLSGWSSQARPHKRTVVRRWNLSLR